MKTPRLILLGGGGHASDVYGVLEAIYQDNSRSLTIDVLGYVDIQNNYEQRFAKRGLQYLGGFDVIETLNATHFVACAGYPDTRYKVAKIGLEAGLEPYTLLHPRAWIPDDVEVGEGSVVLAGTSISPGAKLGMHTYISTNTVIGHDSEIGGFVSVMPGACISGDVSVGERTMIGLNASVIQGKKIGRQTQIGAGAVVVQDIPDNVVAIGVPAKWKMAPSPQ